MGTEVEEEEAAAAGYVLFAWNLGCFEVVFEVEVEVGKEVVEIGASSKAADKEEVWRGGVRER